jgi:tellurite resistance protein TehA-like permease
MRGIAGQIRSLYPGYFALVMATGIISNAARVMRHPDVSNLLFAVNLIAYPLLLIAIAARISWFRRELWTDLTDPKLVFSFFTIVAASNVFGIQLLMRGYTGVATGLWVFALLVWIALSYFSFSVLAFLNTHRGADVIHGGWLIGIVGTESLVVLGVQLVPHLGAFAPLTSIGVYIFWGVGIVFYGIFITLFSYRLFFLRVDPAELTPLLWVVMGAAAIGTNAGSTLLLAKTTMPFLLGLRPFVQGTSLILWAWGTWWIPLLVLIGFWKHGVRRVPLQYHPMLWSLVFPLGMYTLATYRLSLVTDFPPFLCVPRVMLWVATATWALTMSGMLSNMLRRNRS